MARTFTALGAQRLLTPATGLYNLKAATFAFRVLPTSTPATDTNPLEWADVALTGGLSIRLIGTTLNLQIIVGFATSFASQANNTALTAGVWNHWAVTCTDLTDPNGTFTFYLNGAVDSGGAYTAGVGAKPTLSTPLSIGNQSIASPTHGFPGSLESVGIWNRQILAYEAAGLALGIPPTEFRAGLVSHYELGSWGGPVKDTESGLVALQEGAIAPIASIWPSRPLDYSRVRARSGAAVALPSVTQRQNVRLQAVNRAATF